MGVAQKRVLMLQGAAEEARQSLDQYDRRLEGAIQQAEKTGRSFSESFQQFCNFFRAPVC